MHRQGCGHALMQSLHMCGACFACEAHGLVTGTCLHSSTARGRLSKNSPNPTGVCVLPSILSPFWPRLEGSEAERAAGHGLWTHHAYQWKHTWPRQANHELTYLAVTDGRAAPLCAGTPFVMETDTRADHRGKHHATTKTHNCSPVENPSTFIDYSSTATRSSFGSCFIREFFMQPDVVQPFEE